MCMFKTLFSVSDMKSVAPDIIDRYSFSAGCRRSLNFNMSMPMVNELSGVRTCGALKVWWAWAWAWRVERRRCKQT